MKTLLHTIALLAGLQLATVAAPAVNNPTDEPATYKLTIRVANVKARQGTINVAITNAETAATGGSYRKTRVAVPASGEVTINFEGLPAGQYAVRMFHDVNSNLKLDYNGPMPLEPFGFSNGPTETGGFSFDHNSFSVNADQTITVQLVQLN